MRQRDVYKRQAPINAPSSTEKKPDRLNTPAVMLPPNSSMTKATPRLAPALMPRMDGPASGFLKAVCNISPQTANAPPQSSAVSAWGKRDSQRMKLQLAFSDVYKRQLPVRTMPSHFSTH